MDEGDQYSPYSLCLEPFGSCMDTATTKRKGKSKSKNKNKRRFTDEQIRSLESMFETEARLEPRKKIQLAKELGLQPRQVAIWFQNKRARWKSKQLERDYNVLLNNYNSLASRFESLKKEKLAIATQLRKLNEIMKEQGQGTSSGEEGGNYGKSGEGDSKDIGESGQCTELEKKETSLSVEKSEQGGGGLVGGMLSDEDSSIKAEYFGLDEEPDLMAMVEPADGSMTSQEDWGSLESDVLFNQENSGYQWWDFWSS